MTIEKVRDGLLILAAVVFLWVYASGWVVSTFIEKVQAQQKVSDLTKQVSELEKKVKECEGKK